MAGAEEPLLVRVAARLGVPAGHLRLLPARGFGHDHVLVGEGEAVVRVPRQGDGARLAFLAAGFSRGSASGHVPRPLMLLPPGPDLPCGALLVEAVAGRPPRLPADMPAIARALAAIHRLPLPAETGPIPLTGDPVAAILAVARPVLAGHAVAGLAEELAWAAGFKAAPFSPCLVFGDVHPGNFRIRADGEAVFLDVEKHSYSHPAIDLAHASLPSSTGFDPDLACRLTRQEVIAFHRAYGPLPPDILPFRRLVFLRTTAFAAAMRQPPGEGSFAAHVADWAAGLLRPEAIAATRAEWLGPTALPL